ncbi:D-alanyl-D-alanine carboxypeptidase [Streptomyces sp. NPDC095613]|uniref:D-alanyl-D-alanine carboxypeptidase n=1 Tax=Streptomyces sp. NPDC095613 TaxID=3155540 RepID=UPI003332B9F9
MSTKVATANRADSGDEDSAVSEGAEEPDSSRIAARSEVPESRAGETPGGKSEDGKPGDGLTDEAGAGDAEKSGDGPEEKSGEKSRETSGGKAGEKPGKASGEKSAEQLGETDESGEPAMSGESAESAESTRSGESDKAESPVADAATEATEADAGESAAEGRKKPDAAADEKDAAPGGTAGEGGAGKATGAGTTGTGTGSRGDAGGKADEAADAAAGTAGTTGGDKADGGDVESPVDQPTAVFTSRPRSKADGGGDGTADGGDVESPVDQPTAVFTSRPKPKTDQPTTALKLPPSSRDEKKHEPNGKAEPGVKAEPDEKTESPAERTSTFVPLRRDDDVRSVDAKAAAKAQPAAAPMPTSSEPSKPSEPPKPGGGAEPPAAVTSAIPEAERTRQQPMPPKPPLDLLAELTNKPAPPETPVRVAVRRVKIWTPLVLLVLIVFAIVQAVRPLPDPALGLTADSEYTFDGGKPSLPWPDEGQGAMSVSGLGKVDAFGEEKPVPIASVTKTMTAYIIMRDHPMKPGQDGAQITVDALAEKEGGYDQTDQESTLNTIKEGDKLSQKDALSALMIPSANNVARLLARWDAGSQEAFVKKMNATAKQLGMTNTTYTDPSGLDATTVSTAADQVKLGLEVVKYPALLDITKLPSWTDPSGKTHRNWNTLVPYDGALGIKTGTTTKAGGNLLFAAKKDVGGTDQYLVGAILGQHTGGSIIDIANERSKTVMLATQELLESRTVVKKGDVVGHVDDGLGGLTPVVATKDLKAAGWASLKVAVELTDGGKTIPHTAEAGTVVGKLTVGSGPGQVSAPVALQSDLAEPGFGAKLTRVS